MSSRVSLLGPMDKQAVPPPFPAVRAVCWSLLVTGCAVAAHCIERIPCYTQCFWILKTRALPRMILCCGVAQAAAAALAGRPRRALASVSLAAAIPCHDQLATFVAVLFFHSGENRVDLGAMGLVIAYALVLGVLVFLGFHAVLWGAE